MERIDLLQTLLDREKDKRDAALAEWRAACAQAEAARQQADSLVAYRAEYQARWRAQFSRSATIEVLRCYQGFIERLEQAVQMQQGVLAQAMGRADAARDRLRHRETKVATVQRLIERRLQAAQLREHRRDQKTTDEAAQRLGWARSAALAAA